MGRLDVEMGKIGSIYPAFDRALQARGATSAQMVEAHHLVSSSIGSESPTLVYKQALDLLAVCESVNQFLVIMWIVFYDKFTADDLVALGKDADEHGYAYQQYSKDRRGVFVEFSGGMWHAGFFDASRTLRTGFFDDASEALDMLRSGDVD
jgi:hypothetical protein